MERAGQGRAGQGRAGQRVDISHGFYRFGLRKWHDKWEKKKN